MNVGMRPAVGAGVSRAAGHDRGTVWNRHSKDTAVVSSYPAPAPAAMPPTAPLMSEKAVHFPTEKSVVDGITTATPHCPPHLHTLYKTPLHSRQSESLKRERREGEMV